MYPIPSWWDADTSDPMLMTFRCTWPVTTPPNIYGTQRTSIEHLSNIGNSTTFWCIRRCLEDMMADPTPVWWHFDVPDLPKIQRSSIENLTNIYRTSIEHRKFNCIWCIRHRFDRILAHPTPFWCCFDVLAQQIQWESIENPMSIYQTSIKHLPSIYQTFIEHASNIDRTSEPIPYQGGTDKQPIPRLQKLISKWPFRYDSIEESHRGQNRDKQKRWQETTKWCCVKCIRMGARGSTGMGKQTERISSS